MSKAWRGMALAAAAASAAMLAAQPFDPPPDRRRAVGDWLVEHVAEEDGGRIVRISREDEAYLLSYHSAHWRGNHHPYRGGSVRWHGCSRGGEEAQAEALPAAAVRALLTEWLAQCDAPPGEIRALLDGLERAFALAASWNRDAEAATAAEIQAIIDHPDASTEPENVTACGLSQMNEAGYCQPR